MELKVHSNGRADWNDRPMRCALGRSGIAADKNESDGATPAGVFAMRRVLYRPDRLQHPETMLPCEALTAEDGWCDDSEDGNYNRQVRLPCSASCEKLWRDDGIYDLIVVLGHNDAPVERGKGSAIFLHIARPDYSPTEGCVAVSRADLLDILSSCRPGDAVRTVR